MCLFLLQINIGYLIIFNEIHCVCIYGSEYSVKLDKHEEAKSVCACKQAQRSYPWYGTVMPATLEFSQPMARKKRDRK